METFGLFHCSMHLVVARDAGLVMVLGFCILCDYGVLVPKRTGMT
jgi:hypothetical protein